MLIDTHAHLDFPDFSSDLAEVVERAQRAGVERIISIGTDEAASARAVALAERFPSVYAAVGWHPGHFLDAPEDITRGLQKWVNHPKVVAIGECGLDYYRMPSANGGNAEDEARLKVVQERVFRQQLELAAATGLNLVVHTRESFADTLRIFAPYANRVRAVFHCFIGTPEQMREVIALGSMVSFTGISTFKNAANVRTTLESTPLESFMVETDAPFLAPVPHRGRRCEPAYVADLASFIAEFRGISLAQLASTTSANAHRLFPRLS